MLILGKNLKKFKGLFKLKPLKTKYHAVWDVNILLNFLENMSTDSEATWMLAGNLTVCSCCYQVHM